MKEKIKKAIYVGVDAPTDEYREILLEYANIGMLTARLIDMNFSSFIKAMEDILEKESPELIVLDENMPADLMMETFAMSCAVSDIKNKTVKVYGVGDGMHAAELSELTADKIEDYLRRKSKTPHALIMGELDY